MVSQQSLLNQLLLELEGLLVQAYQLEELLGGVQVRNHSGENDNELVGEVGNSVGEGALQEVVGVGVSQFHLKHVLVFDENELQLLF